MYYYLLPGGLGFGCVFVLFVVCRVLIFSDCRPSEASEELRGSCARPIKAPTRPPRTPCEEAPAGSPKSGHHDIEKSYGKVQASAGKGRHSIWRMPGGLARRHNGGPSVEGDLRQEPGIV